MMTSTSLRAHLVLPILASVALGPVAGCDGLEMPEEEEVAATDTDGDMDLVSEDGSVYQCPVDLAIIGI